MGWLGTWKNRLSFTVESDYVDSDLTNYPLQLRLATDSGINTFDASAIFSELEVNNLKIAITTDDGYTQCYVEIERWDDTNQIAILHFKAPSLSSSVDTTFYIYYDNSKADNTTYVGTLNSDIAENVWDSNHKYVCHMANNPAGNSPQILDSTSYNHDGTTISMLEEDLTTNGLEDTYALIFDGANNRFEITDSPDLDFGASTDFTIEAVVYTNDNSNNKTILDKRQPTENYGYVVAVQANGTIRCILFESSPNQASIYSSSSVEGGWHYIVITLDRSGNGQIYIDGATDGSAVDISGVGNIDSTAKLTIGYKSNPNSGFTLFDGKMSEVRISNVLRTAAWIKANDYNFNDNLLSFLTTEAFPSRIYKTIWSGIHNAFNYNNIVSGLPVSSTSTCISSINTSSYETSISNVDYFKVQFCFKSSLQNAIDATFITSIATSTLLYAPFPEIIHTYNTVLIDILTKKSITNTLKYNIKRVDGKANLLITSSIANRQANILTLDISKGCNAYKVAKTSIISNNNQYFIPISSIKSDLTLVSLTNIMRNKNTYKSIITAIPEQFKIYNSVRTDILNTTRLYNSFINQLVDGQVNPSVTSLIVNSNEGVFKPQSITLDPAFLVSDRWDITFDSPTTYTIAGQESGIVSAGNINTDLVIQNPSNSMPFMALSSSAFRGLYLSGDSLYFNTQTANYQDVDWDVLLDGRSIKDIVSEVSISRKLSESISSIEVVIADVDYYQKCDEKTLQGQQRITVTVNNLNYSFLIEEREISESYGAAPVLSVWGRQKAALLTEGFANVVNQTFTNTSTTTIAENLANGTGVSVSWQADNYNVNEFGIDGYPFDAIVELAAAIGATVQTNESGNIIVKPKHEKDPVTGKSIISARLDDDNIFDISQSIQSAQYSKVTVNINSDSITYDSEFTVEAVEDDETCNPTANFKIYKENPSEKYELCVIPSGFASQINSSRYENVTEAVQVQDGSGSTSKPIRKILSYSSTQCSSAGTAINISFEAGTKEITTEDVESAIVELTYETSYDEWEVRHGSDDEVKVFAFTDDENKEVSEIIVSMGKGDRDGGTISNSLVSTQSHAVKIGKAYLYENFYQKVTYSLTCPFLGLERGDRVLLENSRFKINAAGIVTSTDISIKIENNVPVFEENIEIVVYEKDNRF